MTPMENAANALWRSSKAAMGVSVTYTQGGTTITATAVPGTTDVELQNTQGMVTTEKIQDFIFLASDLLGLLPKRNDKIAWASRTFQVVNPTGGRQWQNVDPSGLIYRVHTKEINSGS